MRGITLVEAGIITAGIGLIGGILYSSLKNKGKNAEENSKVSQEMKNIQIKQQPNTDVCNFSTQKACT